MGKVIHWELCKKFKSDHTTKWYKHKQAPFLENEMHKILWDLKIEADYLIPARRTDVVIINKINKKTKQKQTNKKPCRLVDFVVPADYSEKIKESETKDKFLEFYK